jgi:PPOX class probable F420-dependent enzyme
MTQLTQEQAAYFEAANFAAFGTIRKDGSPHVSPVWVDYDGQNVVVNTQEGRAKWKHLVRDPRATLQVTNPENPYHYIEVSGTATLTTEGGDEHIDKLAKKYLGADSYPFRQPGDVRVIVKIAPDRVTYWTP